MQTQLADFIANSAAGKEADAILRSCVHCGFCTATCPTYQLLGDEDDGPRGRIYLIKSVLEGQAASVKTQTHLDRCLSCRACETTCPSGVNYHRLLDIGRAEVDKQVARPRSQRLLRWLLLQLMTRRPLFSPLLILGQWFRPLLPSLLKDKIPARQPRLVRSQQTHTRRVLLLEGCVQPAMAPNTNIATERVLNALGIGLQRVTGEGCCGALAHHLNAPKTAETHIQRNIDIWQTALKGGAEAIVVNASGCGAHIKDYGKLLSQNRNYAPKAQEIADKSIDIASLLLQEEARLNAILQQLPPPATALKVAFQSPCTLQHGQGIKHVVEKLLRSAGYQVVAVADSHLCCGSAGTYSIFEAKLSTQLRANKLQALYANQPDVIATANIGCHSHLQAKSKVPVKHWIELIDAALQPQHLN